MNEMMGIILMIRAMLDKLEEEYARAKEGRPLRSAHHDDTGSKAQALQRPSHGGYPAPAASPMPSRPEDPAPVQGASSEPIGDFGDEKREKKERSARANGPYETCECGHARMFHMHLGDAGCDICAAACGGFLPRKDPDAGVVGGVKFEHITCSRCGTGWIVGRNPDGSEFVNPPGKPCIHLGMVGSFFKAEKVNDVRSEETKKREEAIEKWLSQPFNHDPEIKPLQYDSEKDYDFSRHLPTLKPEKEFHPIEAQQFDPANVAAAHRKLLPQRIAEMPFDVPVVLFPYGDWPWLFVKRPDGKVFSTEIKFDAQATNDLAGYRWGSWRSPTVVNQNAPDNPIAYETAHRERDEVGGSFDPKTDSRDRSELCKARLDPEIHHGIKFTDEMIDHMRNPGSSPRAG